MRRLVAGLALALAGCAHGGGSSAHPASQPHQPLGLTSPEGVSGDQGGVLEDALCQALVEANHGDVSCPSAVRAALQLARERAASTGDVSSADAAGATAQQLPDRQVHAKVSQADGQWLLDLTYVDKPGAKPAAEQTLKTATYDDLVLGAPAAAKALLE